MRVIAIEFDRATYARLEETMTPYVNAGVAIVRFGTLETLIDPLLRYVRGDPVFFFIDPFGVDGLDAALLPRLLQVEKSEILLLFADEGAVRLAGKDRAAVPTRESLLEGRRRHPSLFGEDFDSLLAAADRRAVDRVLAGHASNSRATEILNTAFGGDWWRPIIEATPAELRRSRFVALYQDVSKRAGATHVLPFGITTEQGRHKYTLLHASKHKRAFAAMKDAMHRARGQRRRPDAATLFDQADEGGLQSVAMDSGADLQAVVDAVCRHFAGKEVRWTGAYGDHTVKAFLRDETPLLFHEFDQVQRALKERADVVAANPLRYRFPPL